MPAPLTVKVTVTPPPHYDYVLVRFSGTFADASGNAVDPSSVEFTQRLRGGPEVTHTYNAPGSPIVRDSTGAYHIDMDTTNLSRNPECTAHVIAGAIQSARV